MLVGGHVSPAGGLVNAHARGVERGCKSIQYFHQNPRAWRPTKHREEDLAAFRELMEAGPIGSVLIHAVYLINCASKVQEIREKSLASLVHALRLGDAIGSAGVVLHPGSQVGEPLDESLARVGEALRHGFAESERCPVLLENTAGPGQTLGRTFFELADLVDRAGGDERVGLCLDCCHLLASGFEIRSEEALAKVIDECVEQIGLDRLRALHVNDSKTGLGSQVDRHANLPEGELGRRGLSVFLSEPRFEGLPAVLEVPGPSNRGPDAAQIKIAKRLRAEGLKRRAA